MEAVRRTSNFDSPYDNKYSKLNMAYTTVKYNLWESS